MAVMFGQRLIFLVSRFFLGAVPLGMSGISDYLNSNGYAKKKRQNNTLEAFSTSFVKAVLDNPVYCGKIAYGRRKNESIA